MKNTLFAGFLATAALALGTLAPAQATPINWDLESVAFDDGATVSGSFVYDADTSHFTNFNVSVSGGSLPSFTYDMSNAGAYLGGGFGPNNFILFANNGLRYFNFAFGTALDNSGGTHALLTGTSYECANCSPYRLVTAGSVTAEAAADVPEPASAMLVGLGLLGLSAARRRKNG